MKKNIAIVLLSILSVVFLLADIGANNINTNQTTQDKATIDKLQTCSNQASDLAGRMLTYYNGLVDWQNSGYAIDDYTAGSLNAQTDQWTADQASYNNSCTSSGIQT